MKKQYFITLLFIALTNIAIAKPIADPVITFTDSNFKSRLLESSTSNTIAKNTSGNYFKIDANNNGEIEVSEAQNVSYLGIWKQLITNVSGIEHFTNLTALYCYENRIASLDLSQNTKLIELYCYNNFLTQINITKNIALTYLSCYNNSLDALDVSQNTALLQLHCDSNQLTALDITKNTSLNVLYCDSNQISTLDVSQNVALNELVCTNNQLTSLNVSAATNLTSLHFFGNKITTLDLSKNTQLAYIKGYNNLLTALDVTKNTALTQLEIATNKITSIDVTRNKDLTTLYINNNLLTALDISKNTVLTKLRCDSNQLVSLNLKNGIKGTSTNFGNNANITTLCADVDEKSDIEALLQNYGYTTITVVTDCFETPPPTGETDQTFCALTNPTVAQLVVSGSAVKWYASASGGNVLPTTNALTSTTYYASQTSNGFESLTRLMVTVTIKPSIVADGALLMKSFCENDKPTIADLGVSNVYEMQKGGTPLDPSTAITKSGDYYYGEYVFDTNACYEINRSTVQVTINNCLGTNDLKTSLSTINTYPNPVQDQLTITSNDTLVSVSIFNVQGQLIVSSTQSVIDTSKLLKGIYLVVVNTNNETVSSKLIKE